MTDVLLQEAIYKARVYSGLKSERDPAEPGYAAKTKLQADIVQVVARHWRKQKKAIKEQMGFYFPGRKAELNIGAIRVPDDAEFMAQLINLLILGYVGGVGLFLEGVSIGFDPTLTNAEASRWAKQYTTGLIKDIDETTEKAVRRVVADFIDTPGMTIGDVAKRLPFKGYRAKMIAVTETTKAYAEGQLETGRRLAEEWPGVRVVKKWYTNNDSIVCEICGPMNGQEVAIDEMFTTGLGEKIEAPPVHPNCRCWIGTRTRIE